MWGYHFYVVLQRSHFRLHLHFGLPPQDMAPTWAISGEEHHSQGAAALLLPRAGSWEPPLGGGGGSTWGEQCSSVSTSVLIAFADCVEYLDISSSLSHAVFDTSHVDCISVVYHRGNDVTYLDFRRLIMRAAFTLSTMTVNLLIAKIILDKLMFTTAKKVLNTPGFPDMPSLCAVICVSDKSSLLELWICLVRNWFSKYHWPVCPQWQLYLVSTSLVLWMGL